MRKGVFAICSVLLVLVVSIAALAPGCTPTTGTIEVEKISFGIFPDLYCPLFFEIFSRTSADCQGIAALLSIQSEISSLGGLWGNSIF